MVVFVTHKIINLFFELLFFKIPLLKLDFVLKINNKLFIRCRKLSSSFIYFLVFFSTCFRGLDKNY